MFPNLVKSALISNYTPPAEKGEPGAVADAGKPAPVFISAQSLTAFPVSSLVTKLIWEILKRLDVPHAGGNMCVLVIALIVGGVLFLITIDDANSRPKGGIQWLIALFIGLVNSLFLFAAVIGLSVALPASTGAPPPGTP
jgi:hypothetical protein